MFTKITWDPAGVWDKSFSNIWSDWVGCDRLKPFIKCWTAAHEGVLVSSVKLVFQSKLSGSGWDNDIKCGL